MNRVIFYIAFFVHCLITILLIQRIKEAPFVSADMRDAYYAGCNFGSRPLDNNKVLLCSKVADGFKEGLDDLDKQMEKFIK